jgi:hypothetical protein
MGTPSSQSISRNLRVLARGTRFAMIWRVDVSNTSPESPTYTNRPSRLCMIQPSLPQFVPTHGTVGPSMLLTGMLSSYTGAAPGNPDTS